MVERFLQHHLRSLPLNEWKEKASFPSLLLLSGIKGIGKKEVALFLAQWLLCDFNQTCQSCPSCLKFLARNHLDFREIQPDQDSLKIDTFREIKNHLGAAPREKRKKIFLIPDVERMTPQAANSILKLFEEPPPNWVFLLTTHTRDLLLPTLLSRCHILHLKPYKLSELSSILQDKGYSLEKSQSSAYQAQGSLERALSLAQEDQEIFFQFLSTPSSHLQRLLDWCIQEPSRLESLCNFFERILHELLQWSLHSQMGHPYTWTAGIQGTKQEHLFEQIANSLNQDSSQLEIQTQLIQQLESLQEIRKRATTPVNRKLLTQELLLPWLSLR